MNTAAASKKIVDTTIEVFAEFQERFIVRLTLAGFIVAVCLAGNTEIISDFLLGGMRFLANGS